jgi:hypothetical protein
MMCMIEGLMQDWQTLDERIDAVVLLRKAGEPFMKQEDLHAPHTLYEGISGRGCAARPDQRSQPA